jgi:hypothetical protein
VFFFTGFDLDKRADKKKKTKKNYEKKENMDRKYWIMLVVAAVIGLGCYWGIHWYWMTKQQTTEAPMFPPSADPSIMHPPNFWIQEDGDFSSVCSNALHGKNMGILSESSFDAATGYHFRFGDALLLSKDKKKVIMYMDKLAKNVTGRSAICNLKNAAKTLELVWDHVSSFNNC